MLGRDDLNGLMGASPAQWSTRVEGEPGQSPTEGLSGDESQARLGLGAGAGRGSGAGGPMGNWAGGLSFQWKVQGEEPT